MRVDMQTYEAEGSEAKQRMPAGAAAVARRLLGMREVGLIAIILVLFVVMSLASPYFLTWVNMRAMAMASRWKALSSAA